MSQDNNFGSFVMGFTVGALAGAIASLLLAPQTGEETRQVIKEKAFELKDKGIESYEETKHRAEVACMTKDKAQKMAATAKEGAKDVVEEVKDAAEDIGDAATA